MNALGLIFSCLSAAGLLLMTPHLHPCENEIIFISIKNELIGVYYSKCEVKKWLAGLENDMGL
jgi:hypothetical protein